MEFDPSIYEAYLTELKKDRSDNYIYSSEYLEATEKATSKRYSGLPTPNTPDKKLPENSSFEEKK